MGEPVKRRILDLRSRGDHWRSSSRLPRIEAGSRPPIRRNAANGRFDRLLGDDARLYGLRQTGRTVGPVPHLAQRDDRPSGQSVNGPVPIQYSGTLDDRASLSSDPRRRSARAEPRSRDDAGRLYPLAVDRGESDRNRRRVRRFPDRRIEPYVSSGDGAAVRRAGRGQRVFVDAGKSAA